MINTNKNYTSLVENLSIAIVIHDADTKILFSNQIASKLLGATTELIKGKKATDPLWHFINEDQSILPVSHYPVNQVIKSKRPLKSMILGIVREDLPKPVWVYCNAYPEFDLEGNISQVIVNFTDISEEKKLKDELSELSLLFHAALNQSEAGIAIAVNPSGKLKYLNQAGFLMRGGKENEKVSDIDISEFLGLQKVYSLEGILLMNEESPLYKAMRKGEKTIGEYIIKNIDQEDKVLWINASPIKNSAGEIIAGITIFIDITKKYKLEQELRKAREAAEKETMLKSRFMDVAAHELRNPIAAFSLLVEMAQRKLNQGHQVENQTLNKMQTQVKRITLLIKELLDLSRLERNVIKINKQTTDAVALINECIDEFKLHAPDRKFIFNESKLKIMINIDPIRIYQVLSNLIENATKYAPETSPIIISIDNKKDYLKVTISDYGKAISDDVKNKIFTPFTRITNHETEHIGGLGLGLYISRSIIKLHQGEIGLETKKDFGNTFYFMVPHDSKTYEAN